MSHENPGNDQRDNEGQVVTAPNRPHPGEVPPEPRFVPVGPSEDDEPLEIRPPGEEKPLWEPDPGE